MPGRRTASALPITHYGSPQRLCHTCTSLSYHPRNLALDTVGKTSPGLCVCVCVPFLRREFLCCRPKTTTFQKEITLQILPYKIHFSEPQIVHAAERGVGVPPRVGPRCSTVLRRRILCLVCNSLNSKSSHMVVQMKYQLFKPWAAMDFSEVQGQISCLERDPMEVSNNCCKSSMD